MSDEDDVELHGDTEDFDRIPCSWNYVVICFILPALVGQLTALCFPAYTLHFEAMGWSLISAGMAVTTGFVLRALVQQIFLLAGYWSAVPLCMIHSTFASLALAYTTSQWAVFAQLVAVFSIDCLACLEGIAFDAFGASEVQAKKATSLQLSVWTINLALSCTFGGIVYDAFGWTGIAAVHTTLSGLLALMFCIHPACRNSFMQFFFKVGDSADVESTESSAVENGEASKERVFTHVVPGTTEPKTQFPGATEELQIEEVGSDTDESTQSSPKMVDSSTKDRQSKTSKAARRSGMSNVSDRRSKRSNLSVRRSGLSARNSQHSSGTHNTAGTGRSELSNSTFKTKETGWTYATRQTARTIFTAVSRMTELHETGEQFTHRNNALNVRIVGATASKSVVRNPIEDQTGGSAADDTAATGGGIPKGIRFPAFLIVLNAALNNTCYNMEYATFAIYFKHVHNWNEATLAGIAQTAGDLVAAISMQLIPVFMSGEFNPDEAGCLRRFWHHITSQPYNLSFLLATWILFNLGMMSPQLAVAILAQIFMGTTYVYSTKWTTDMNLFYSMGDAKVFLTLQVICRNAEALGGALAGILGTFLYTVDPLAPFMFTASLSCFTFIVYTAGFCVRLGFGDDIETAEEKRARRKGLRRVSSWANDTVSRKTTDSVAAETVSRKTTDSVAAS